MNDSLINEPPCPPKHPPDISVETLPAWTYDNAEFHALEKERIFMRTWQVVCHVSDLPEAGDWVRFDLMAESAFVMRGADGEVRAFYNVCRHRANRLVHGHSGHCEGALSCTYHGWTYGLDGGLVSVPAEDSFPGLERARFGLKTVSVEIWLGFVFLRFEGSAPSVAEIMAPYADELAQYRFADLQPLGRQWSREAPIDWKNAIDNNIEGYHIAIGHPGLQRLFGRNYGFETRPYGIARAGGVLAETSANWTERHYLALLDALDLDHLTPERRRSWHYYSLFPNMAIDVYPDTVDFFQMLPVGPGRCLLRGRTYGLADRSREMRAARYLSGRINNLVGQEDVSLVEGVQAGLKSRSYTGGILSDHEQRVREFHSLIRTIVPVAGQHQAPPLGTVAGRNVELSRG